VNALATRSTDIRATKRRPKKKSGTGRLDQKLRAAPRRQVGTEYVLRLYVAGMSQRSTAAIKNITEICDAHLPGRYDLEVIDIYQHPTFLQRDQIIAVPTLVKKQPIPVRCFIGDLANREKVLLGLDLQDKL